MEDRWLEGRRSEVTGRVVSSCRLREEDRRMEAVRAALNACGAHAARVMADSITEDSYRLRPMTERSRSRKQTASPIRALQLNEQQSECRSECADC